MDDLISRSALLEDIEQTVVFTGRAGVPNAEIRGANKITDRIKAAPAVDLDSLRARAIWRDKAMTVPGAHGQTYRRYGCTRCKAKVKTKTNYCPRCGAKMEVSEDE